LPYQQAWIADTSQVKLFTKSRRIGISWAEAADATLTASARSGQNVTYICYDKDITRQFVKDCADWAKSYNLAASTIDESQEVFRDGDEDKSILVYRIYFDSGFEIEAIAGTPRKLRGRKGRIVIDEAAFLDDLGAVIEAALALLIWGGDLHLITTYNGVDNAYYELEQDVLAGKLPYSRHFCTFRQAVAQGLYERICAVQNRPYSRAQEDRWVEEIYRNFADRADQELDCIPSRSGVNYLSRAIVEQCMDAQIPIVSWNPDHNFVNERSFLRESECQDWIEDNLVPLLDRVNPNLKSYVGLDFGRSGDITVVLPLQEQENLLFTAPFALELRDVPFDQQRQIVFSVLDRLPRFMAGAFDARGNGSYLAEVAMQRYGSLRIMRVQATGQWYADNFPRYKAWLEDRQVRLPLSSNWIDDHRMVIVERGIPKVSDGRNKGNDGKQRHGDSAIAGVLACFATRSETVPIEFSRVTGPRFGYSLDDFLSG
jgi:phage FluMu gp28-like protein